GPDLRFQARRALIVRDSRAQLGWHAISSLTGTSAHRGMTSWIPGRCCGSVVEGSVLFLSYLFPPRGGAACARARKFAEYLPEFGWRPLVVAHGMGGVDEVPSGSDASLLKDLGPEAVVRYTRVGGAAETPLGRVAATWRRRLAATDSMGWWVKPAV